MIGETEESSEMIAKAREGAVDGRSRARGSVRLAALVLVCGLRLLVPKAAQAQQPAGDAWVGRRVVQRFNEFTLYIENRVVDRKRAIHFYRVEQVNGPWLWVHAEGNGFSGWGLADHVIAVDHAIEFFGAQLRANPQDAFSYVMRATLWQDQKQIDKALADFDQAIRLNPTQAWIFNDRGILWTEKNDHDKALADFNQAIRLEPNNANVYNNRGSIWRAKRVYDEAIQDFTEAIRLNPEYAYAYYNRGLTRADKKLFDGAIADFNEVVRLDPRDAYAYYNRGLAWAERKEYDKAIADFDQAARLEPGYHHAHYHRGRARSARGDYDQAIADFNRALQLAPKSFHTYYDRAHAWAGKKEYGKAIADFDEAIRLNPQFDDAYLSRAWLLATCPDTKYRNPKQAVELAIKACELTGWHQAHDLGGLAAVYAQTGNVAAAVKWQSKAIELLTGEEATAGLEAIQVLHH